ncbi:MAG: DUF1579 family protein [Planctomycetes bacterium]|nr:DUF1579 family protein [Planctomycetota bacterium]
MPAPGPAHALLERLCGEFTGEETMFPSPWSPESQQRTCTISARMLEGFFAVSDYEQRMGGEVTFRGHGVYSYDPQAERYKMYWFDSMGGAGGIAEGTVEGDVLTFENRSPMGFHRYRYTFSADHTVFEMLGSQDGESWQKFMEGRYRRT